MVKEIESEAGSLEYRYEGNSEDISENECFGESRFENLKWVKEEVEDDFYGVSPVMTIESELETIEETLDSIKFSIQPQWTDSSDNSEEESSWEFEDFTIDVDKIVQELEGSDENKDSSEGSERNPWTNEEIESHFAPDEDNSVEKMKGEDSFIVTGF